jgi:hypothetical protein
MKEPKTLSLHQLQAKMGKCSGCRNNFYNHPSAAKPGEGTSATGRCWSLPEAKAVWRWAINMRTPMDRKENFRRVQVYNCFHGDGPHRDIYMQRLPSHLGGTWADKKEQKEAGE